MKKRTIRGRLIALSAITTLGLAACGGNDSSAECPTIADGKLTIATGNPAYYPWVADDAPESKQGFEAAVAYAVAGELGYADADVVWVRTGFDEAIQPG
ncbi:MAG: amino acid ABC transporter substrate-binding protein, partial [Actinomycetota bacterium]